jgi:hypothetical protein
MSDRPTRPVEYQPRSADSPQPALELVDQRRVDGVGPDTQARTVVVVSTDDGPQQVDVPQECVTAAADDQRDLIASVLGDAVGGEA